MNEFDKLKTEWMIKTDDLFSTNLFESFLLTFAFWEEAWTQGNQK